MKKIANIVLLIACITLIFVPVAVQTASASELFFEETAVINEEKIYLGGIPIGVIADSGGIIVTDFVDVISKDGTRCPAKESGLTVGDLITKINGVDMRNVKDIKRVIDKNTGNKPLDIEFIRNNVKNSTKLEPSLDTALKEYKLGIIAKNDIAGVGTLTYIKSSDGRFGGLGHRIYDSANPNIDLYKKGNIFACTIVGSVKGSNGKAGELRGVFERGGKPKGKVDKNNDFGIFGYADKEIYKDLQQISIGSKSQVKMGKAHIYTTINGCIPEKYEIEIIKNVRQDGPEQKGMVIRITDARLLDKTGGIVQGMSGSPIIQNDRLIGAVTHVFLNDATKGYGIYIDWMIGN